MNADESPLRKLQAAGVTVWLDYLSRDLLDDGGLQALIDRDGLGGETSNPTIFQKAIAEGHAYDAQIEELARRGLSTEAIAWELMISDVQRACDQFASRYQAGRAACGYVSLEVSPLLARDGAAALVQARDLWRRVARANLLIKIPATREGLPVIETLLYEGISVNVTLLFAVQRYEDVMDAHLRALERRVAERKPLETVASVASFFVSRVDTEVDKHLEVRLAAAPESAARIQRLRGKVAVANACVAYERYLARYHTSDRFAALRARGAQVQNPLWASTGTKNRDYRDTLYVEDLIGPDVVNTMPPETLAAFRDHGIVHPSLTPSHLEEARRVLDELQAVGVDLDDITLHTLEEDGVRKFTDSYHGLLGAVEHAREKVPGRT